jgi:hypothetical protein
MFAILACLILGYQLNSRLNMVTDRAAGIAIVAYALLIYVLARFIGINWYTVWGTNVPLSKAQYFLLGFFVIGVVNIITSFRKRGNA